MRSTHVLVTGLTAMTLSACAVPADLSVPFTGDVAGLGTRVVSQSTVVEGLPFALPDGEWNTVYTHHIGEKAAPETYKVFASVHAGIINRAAIFWVQTKDGEDSDKWSRFQGCLTWVNDGVLFSEVTTNVGSNDSSAGLQLDCWHVRGFSLGRNETPHPTIEALQAFADQEDLYLPVTMLSVRYAQKRGPDNRDYADYLFNTDLLLQNEDDQPWLPEDWSATSVSSSPAKSLIVERLVAWGEEWRPNLLTSEPAS